MTILEQAKEILTVIESAEAMRQQAVALLTKERERIDTLLAQLGDSQEKAPSGKKRGRKPKTATPPAEPLFRPESSPTAAL